MAAASGRPSLVLVGGVNGSGKSTFAAAAAGTSLLLGQTAINPDDLTKSALGEWPSLKQRGANLVGVERAEKAVWRAIAEGRSVAVETVLSSDKFQSAVLAARHRVYETRLIFVGVPTVDVAISRVKARVAQGGHGVPSSKIRSRWKRAHDNLGVFLGLVDDVMIVSNEGGDPVVVAERIGRDGPLTLILEGVLPSVDKVLSRLAKLRQRTRSGR